MPYKDPKVAKEKSKERWLRWHKRNENRPLANATMRAWRRKNYDWMLHHHAKRRAERDGIPFEITKEDIPAIPAICPIAQIPIHFRPDAKRGPCDNSPSLDKVDDSKGYVKGNIRIVSHKGNRWKSNMSIKDVERLLAYMKGEI